MRHLYSAFYQRMQSALKIRERWVLRAFLKDVMLVEFLTDGEDSAKDKGQK